MRVCWRSSSRRPEWDRSATGPGAGPAYLHDFIEELKASGFVVQAISRAGLVGVPVAPPASGR